MRKIRYQEIADELRRRARAAPPGSVLPSESELSAAGIYEILSR